MKHARPNLDQRGTKNPSYKHGMRYTKTYAKWKGMRDRCKYPTTNDYHLYGGRGITVCKRWHLFANFLADMGVCPDGYTLDRIDSNGNYEPSNCRWATWKQQGRNKPSNKLSEADARYIREHWHLFQKKILAEKFNCSIRTLYRVKTMETWA